MRQKSSIFEGVGDPVEEVFMALVSRETKDAGAVGTDKPTGAIEDLEAKRLRLFQQEEAGAFHVSNATR